jgi:lysyl-tRNA synthetase class 2
MSVAEQLKARARLMAETRLFFADRGVLEVSTPTLSRYASTSPLLDSFSVSPVEGDASELLYLQTSPEFMMKRLLSEGAEAIYQICQSYRAGEFGRRHNPEFQMLEWYRPGFSLFDLMHEVEQLFRSVLGETVSHWKTERIRFETLFERVTGLNPFSCDEDAFRLLALQKGILHSEENALIQLDRDGWVDLLMGCVVEPTLCGECFYFVHGYPASQAALARIDPDDSRTAERFEVYAAGMELGNGYRELTDATEQLGRFQGDVRERARLGKAAVPFDKELVSALERGIPECSGVAVGMDRLLMLKCGCSHIAQVMPLSWEAI